MQGRERSATRRSGALGWSSAAASVILLFASAWQAGGRRVGAELADVDLRWLAAALGIYAVQLLLLGMRWSLIARELGLKLGLARATGEYAVSILVNQVLPTGIAGDTLRALRHARALPDDSVRTAVEALVIDRASGQLALLLLAFATAPLAAEELVDPRKLAQTAGGVLVAGAVLALAMTRFVHGRRLLAGLRGFFERAARVLLRPRSAVVHLPLSVTFVLSTLLGFYVAARALAVDVSAIELLSLGPCILLAASVPASIGGWGFREGASALLFGAAGLGAATGLAISVVYGLFSLLVSVAGFAGWLALQLVRRRRVRV